MTIPYGKRKSWNRAALQLSFVWVVLAVSPGIAKADIIYTWTSTGGETASGTLDVVGSAPGSFDLPNVASFSWTYTNAAYSDLSLDGFPFAIGANGIPTEEGKSLMSFDGTLVIQFDSSAFGSAFPVGWSSSGGSGNSGNDGLGYWSVALTASPVPEPSTRVLLGSAIFSGIMYGQVRKRRRRSSTFRRQGTAPRATGCRRPATRPSSFTC
jgi:hypothetical protein